jgi:hypothetical protein
MRSGRSLMLEVAETKAAPQRAMQVANKPQAKYATSKAFGNRTLKVFYSVRNLVVLMCNDLQPVARIRPIQKSPDVFYTVQRLYN